MDLFIFALWALFVVVFTRPLVLLYFSYKHRKRETAKHDWPYHYPLVSILVPCYNEAETVGNCVRSLVAQSYPKIEVLIIDDGSTDATKSVGKQLARTFPDKVRLLSKENGGKGSALNYGIANAAGSIITVIDADTVFCKDTMRHLVRSFDEPGVDAVCGNVRVPNKGNLLTLQQTVEYVSGLNMEKRAFDYIGCTQVIPGCIGAFRKNVLLEVGGYSADTLVEDMDLTIELVKRQHRVVYNSAALSYTEVPETLKNFIKQRRRWMYGLFQVIKKHREALFNPKYGTLGMVGMPYFLLFPFIEIFAVAWYGVVMVRALFFGIGLLAFILFLAVNLTLQVGLLMYSLHLDGEKKKYSLLLFTQMFFYYPFMDLIRLEAGFDYLSGAKMGWNKMVRLGKNILPASNT